MVSFLSSLVCFWGFYPYPCFCSENTFCDCYYLKGRLSVTNLSSEITCQHFDIMFQLSSGWKQKRCQQPLLFIAMHYWEYTSLKAKGRWGLFLLPPASSSLSDPLGGNHNAGPWQRTGAVVKEALHIQWHPQRSASTGMEDWKSLVAGLLWCGGREGGAILTNFWPPMTCILRSAWVWIAMFALLSLSPKHSVETSASYFPSLSW